MQQPAPRLPSPVAAQSIVPICTDAGVVLVVVLVLVVVVVVVLIVVQAHI